MKNDNASHGASADAAGGFGDETSLEVYECILKAEGRFGAGRGDSSTGSCTGTLRGVTVSEVGGGTADGRDIDVDFCDESSPPAKTLKPLNLTWT